MEKADINYINEYIEKRRKNIRKQFDKPINPNFGMFLVEEMETLIHIQKILENELIHSL